MAKRFTENTKWEDKWFRKLSPKCKLFWLFIVDRCDIAGFWETDWELASFYIGENIDESILNDFNGRLKTMPDGKIWIVKFVAFQYGKLNPAVHLHKSVINILEEKGLIKTVKGSLTLTEGFGKGSVRAKVKVRVKDSNNTIHNSTKKQSQDKLPEEKDKGDCKGEEGEAITPEVVTPKEKKLTAIQEVVEYWKAVMGFDKIEGWDKANFPRCAKSAKNILAMSNNDTETAKQAIADVIKYHEEAGLSYTLETVVKKFAEWKTGKLIPKNKTERRRQGNLEAVRKFAEGG